MTNAQEMLNFINKSRSPFHAVKCIEEMLTGYEKLNENEAWHLVPGNKYYVTRNLSSIIAFTMPKQEIKAFNIVASHSDSPTFKIKDNAEISVNGKYTQLNVERYGGAILSTWFDRPLSIAGRVLVSNDDKIETKLIDFDRDTVIIPNTPIHMNKDLNNGFVYNVAKDLCPMWKLGTGSLKQAVAKELDISEDSILGMDLLLYNRMPGVVWGEDDEFVSSGRLDDLECAYSSIKALIGSAVSENVVNIAAVFDNEEVGSSTKQGANSTFLEDFIERVVSINKMSLEEKQIAISKSFMLSADNAHACHPNHPELFDSRSQVYMNEGIVIKFNANQKYTSDGVSEAIFHKITEKAGVPVQHYANRSDMPGGSTLGNISNTHISLNTVDIGLAQLAMHSSYETAGSRDVDYMVDGMKAFFNTQVCRESDGSYILK